MTLTKCSAMQNQYKVLNDHSSSTFKGGPSYRLTNDILVQDLCFSETTSMLTMHHDISVKNNPFINLSLDPYGTNSHICQHPAVPTHQHLSSDSSRQVGIMHSCIADIVVYGKGGVSPAVINIQHGVFWIEHNEKQMLWVYCAGALSVNCPEWSEPLIS